MPSVDAIERLIPERRLYLDGKVVEPEQAARISRIVVELADDHFNQCTVLFNDPDLELIQGNTLQPGMGLAVELGFVGKLKMVFDGEIVGLEPRLTRDKAPSILIKAYERIHRLALAPRTRSFQDSDTKAIVGTIAREHGLSPDAPAGSKGHLLQPNLSDFALLRKISSRNGHHLYLKDKKLVVGPPPSLGEMELGPASNVTRLKVRLRTTEQVPKVIARGWNWKDKKEIVGQAAPQGELGDGNTEAKPFARKDFFIAGPLFADQKDAETVAKATVSRIAERYAVASGEIIGNHDVIPGKLLVFTKFGELLDGKYRVTEARHEFDKKGYRVRFEAARVAKKKTQVPFKAAKSQAATAKQLKEDKAKQKKVEEQKQTIEFQLKNSQGKSQSGIKAEVLVQGEKKAQTINTDGSGGGRITDQPKGVNYSIKFLPPDSETEFSVQTSGGKKLEKVKAVVTSGKTGNQELEPSGGKFKPEGLDYGDNYNVLLTASETVEFSVQSGGGKAVGNLRALVEFESGRTQDVKSDSNGNFKVEGFHEDEVFSVTLFPPS